MLHENIEFLLRLIIAGVLGALIGLEREKRFKEAGLRTHFLVAIGSAILMIISKYGFADMLGNDGIGVDPSRIAAQVVSGVGFLGAGMILVQRQSIHGLTTAAGIWTTAAIGMAIGSGMYVVGIIGSVFVLVGLELLKRMLRFAIPAIHQLSIETSSHTSIERIIGMLTESEIEIRDYNVNTKGEGDEAYFKVAFKLQSERKIDRNEIVAKLHKAPGVLSVKMY